MKKVNKNIVIEKLGLNIKGTKIELTLDEAKELAESLSFLLDDYDDDDEEDDNGTTITVTPYPWWFVPYTYPNQPEPYVQPSPYGTPTYPYDSPIYWTMATNLDMVGRTHT